MRECLGEVCWKMDDIVVYWSDVATLSVVMAWWPVAALTCLYPLLASTCVWLQNAEQTRVSYNSRSHYNVKMCVNQR